MAALDLQLHAIATRVAGALDAAERGGGIEAELGDDPERRRRFHEHARRLHAGPARVGPEHPPLAPVAPVDFPAAFAAATGPHAAAIRVRLRAIQAEHDKKLARSPNLLALFDQRLIELGGASLLPLLRVG